MKRSDAELVEAACHGDIDSFGELYRRHYRMAVGMAFIRVADRHLAEDAAQEAFAVACRRLATLTKPDRFPYWLGGICRRVAGRMRKKRWQTNGAAEDAVAPTEGVELARAIQQAVARLPANARQVVVLHYFSGLSHEEIGRVLGVTPAAVHGRLQRARSQLKDDLRSLK